MGSLDHVDGSDMKMAREVHRLAILGVRLEKMDNGVVVNGSKSSLVDEVIAKQDLHSSLLELKALVKEGKVEVFCNTPHFMILVP